MYLGARSFDSAAMESSPSDQLTLGVEGSSRREVSGLGLEVGGLWMLQTQTTSDGSRELDLVDLYLGPRYTQQLGDTELFVYGGGGLDVNATVSRVVGVNKSDDFTVGWGGYVHAGGYYLISKKVQVGLDVRKSFGLDAFGIDIDYLQVAGFVGIAF